MNMRKLRFIRHIILFFAVGFSWGYVAKTFANNFLYIGHDDPQVQLQNSAYPIKPLIDKKNITGAPDTLEQNQSDDDSQDTPTRVQI